MKTFFAWLGIDQKTPAWTSIRNWLQRLGIAELQRPLEATDDLVVIVDHSNQIGVEKVMVALGIPASGSGSVRQNVQAGHADAGRAHPLE